MPYRFDIDHQHRLIRKQVWGRYNDAEAARSFADFARIDVHEAYDELHNLLAVTSYEVTPAMLNRLANESRQQERADFPGKKVAVVAPHDLVFGMANVYIGHHGDSREQIQVFRDLQQAEAWLQDDE